MDRRLRVGHCAVGQCAVGHCALARVEPTRDRHDRRRRQLAPLGIIESHRGVPRNCRRLDVRSEPVESIDHLRRTPDIITVDHEHPSSRSLMKRRDIERLHCCHVVATKVEAAALDRGTFAADAA